MLDLGLVGEAVDEGDDGGGVGKDVVPVGEEFVGGDDGRGALVATGDDLEKEVGGAGVVAEVVDLVDAPLPLPSICSPGRRFGGGGDTPRHPQRR